MSTKPTDPARWAETASGTPTSNLTIASSGHQDTGWTLSEAPTSGLFNWQGNRAYKWFQWLNDGDCTFHNLGASGTLGVAGVSTLGAHLIISAGGLDVTGGLSVNTGGLSVASGQSVALSGGTTLAVGGVSTLTGNVTTGANLTVGGNLIVVGSLPGPDITVHVPLNPFTSLNWAPVVSGGLAYLESSGSGGCYIAIPARSGRVIKAVTFAVRGAAGTEHFNQLPVQKFFKDATTSVSIGSPTPPTVTTTWTDFTVDVTDTTIDDTFDVYLLLDSGSSGLRVKNIRAVYARPQL